ncbi:MAG: GNAT family N-acetyltransferase [Bacteroidaceae bacterium]|nr:GNAT family N-acetyltransferase [Bacteroidaceae bacterium]
MSSGNNKLPLFDALPPAVAKEQLRELWHSVFGDGYEYIDAFFAAYRCEDVVHTLSVGGMVVSALYALPFTLCSDEKSIAAAYIYAVATAPEYRGKGYMALLMKNVERLLAERGVRFIYLLPASGTLRAYYARLGYTDCSSRALERFYFVDSRPVSSVLVRVSSADEIYSSWVGWQAAAAPVVIHSRELLSMNMVSCKMQGGGCFVAKRSGVVVAAAFVIMDGGTPLILDVKGCNDSACAELKCLLCGYYKVPSLNVLVAGSGSPLCMGRTIGDALPATIDISLMLDK